MNGGILRRDERGIALVISMLILLVMSLLGLVLMAGASMNRSLAGNDQRMRQSLNLAEAGIGEAESRISNQETLMDSADPNDVCQVFNTPAGSVPVLGADSVALATGQPAGSYLNYSTPTKGPDELTIAWKKNPTGTKVMRYDSTKPVAMNDATGIPVYTITATGRVGTTRRTVIADVMQKPYTVLAKGALCAAIPITDLGNAVICGYNHSANTPYDDGIKGRVNPAPIPPNDPKYCGDNETGLGGDQAGVWCTVGVTPGGNAAEFGTPPIQQNQGAAAFYTGPWDCFGMSQAEFWGFVGAPRDPSSITNWNGILYLDNDGISENQSASVGPNGVDGEGFLYVDGSLHLNSNFHYKGFIYVEGDFDINGNAWVLGGIVVRGQTNIKSNGGMTLLYSSDAITQELTKYGGQFVTLAWREK